MLPQAIRVLRAQPIYVGRGGIAQSLSFNNNSPLFLGEKLVDKVSFLRHDVHCYLPPYSVFSLICHPKPAILASNTPQITIFLGKFFWHLLCLVL